MDLRWVCGADLRNHSQATPTQPHCGHVDQVTINFFFDDVTYNADAMASDVSDGARDMFMALANTESTRVDPELPKSVRASPRLRDEEEESEEEKEEEKSENEASSEDDEKEDEEEHDSVRDETSHGLGRYREVDEDSAASVASAEASQPFTQFMQRIPPAQRQRHASEAVLIEKTNLLADLERLRSQGIQLSRNWTMDDDVDEMSFEMKRLMIQVDEANNIGMMQSGLQMACTGIEMFSKRYKLLDLDGWSPCQTPAAWPS